MPETAQSLPPSVVASFASILSGFASPKPAAKSAPTLTDRWDDALADDISTLSYEQALRTNGRYRPSNPTSSPSPSAPPDPEPSDSGQIPSSPPSAPSRDQPHSAKLHGARSQLVSLEESRKSASITIRLSHAECEQLRERAASAGLTVSAYLRSCVFEVESLRAQVKDTLAQLRSESAPSLNSVAHSDLVSAQTPGWTANAQSYSANPVKSSLFAWLWRLIAPWHKSPRMANA